jgi:hypothetical protein
MAAAGVDTSVEVAALLALRASSGGWGPEGPQQVTSYDTALALAAVSLGSSPPDLSAAVSLVIGRQAPPSLCLVPPLCVKGWSGDGIPISSISDFPDLTTTAEIVRALAGHTTTQTVAGPLNALSTNVFVIQSTTSTLEIASRLAARFAWNQSSPTLEAELLARIPPPPSLGVWDDTDAYVNAIGLLAVTTRPNAMYLDGPLDDADGDGTPNQADAFPYDLHEQADLDSDGVGNFADLDRDGDGVANANDAFPDSPTEWLNSDSDQLGDNQDEDDDNDGLTDAVELAQGSDAKNADTDGDGVCDGDQIVGECSGINDPCPLLIGETDADGDRVCTPEDRCPLDSAAVADLNDDGECDVYDDDDDGDGSPDVEELAFGSDPRDPGSKPDDIAAEDPQGDADRDGLANAAEGSLGTSPFRMDTDLDGATDYTEYAAQPSTDPLDPGSFPEPVAAVFAGMSFAPSPASEEPPLLLSATGGQPTPTSPDPEEGGAVAAALGFQAQAAQGFDLDDDGLSGREEAVAQTSPLNVDSDGDGFADGPGGHVALARLPAGWDLEPDDFVDGEGDFGTDPANPDDRPGKPGDVAPLGNPDGQLTGGDATVAMRLLAEPALLDALAAQHPPRRTIAEGALDGNQDENLAVDDALWILRHLGGELPQP